MPDTGAPWNIPYVAGTDLVSDWPTDSQALANAIASGLDAADNAGIGSNVVQAVKTDTFSTTSSSFVDVTGLTVTITPTSASSKILLIAQITYSVSGTTGHDAHFIIVGGNTSGYVGDAASPRIQSVFSTMQSTFNGGEYDRKRAMEASSIVYLDSPATTSATTYKVQTLSSLGTSYVNRSGDDGANNYTGRGASSITAIEVAA